jgi:hypothetical protein
LVLIVWIKYKDSDTQNYKSACSFVRYDRWSVTLWENVGCKVCRKGVLRVTFGPEEEAGGNYIMRTK